MIIILTFFIVYFLQTNFFTWFNMAGIMPNLYILLILFIGLFAKKRLGLIFGLIFGTYLDLIMGKAVGISGIILGLIGILGELLSKNFSKDSRFTVMLMVVAATAMFEIAAYIFGIARNGGIAEPIGFIKTLIIEIFFNSLLTILLYPIIKKLGYKLENIYEEKVMLTRFF